MSKLETFENKTGVIYVNKDNNKGLCCKVMKKFRVLKVNEFYGEKLAKNTKK